MTPLHPSNLSLQDELWIAYALEKNPGVMELKAVVHAVIIGKYRAWRLADGIVLTELGHDCVYVVLIAGKNLIRHFAKIFGPLCRYGAESGKRWISGRVFRKGLLEKYMSNFGAVGVDGHVAAMIPPRGQEGLRVNLLVQTPSGVRALNELKVGDKISGPLREQTLVDKSPSIASLVSSRGLAAGQKVWTGLNWETEESNHPCDRTDELLVNITVEPDHVFLLQDGTIVHNLGGQPSAPATQHVDNTTTQTPWGPFEDYFKDIGEEANRAFLQSRGAGQRPQQQAYSQMNRAAQNIGQGGNAWQQMAMNTINGNYLMPESNPALQGAISAALNPIQQRYQEQVLPGISSAAQQMGAYGGSRQGIMEGQAVQGMSREMADAASRIAYGNYANERQNQMMGGQMLGQAGQLQMLPGQLYQQIANQQQNAPFNSVNQYANLINSVPNFGTTRTTGTTSTQGPGTSTAQGILGGAATGASLGSMFGLPGAGIGGVLGGLGGLL